MPSDLAAIDLATLNAAQGVMVAALRDRCCQWEQDSAALSAAGQIDRGVAALALSQGHIDRRFL